MQKYCFEVSKTQTKKTLVMVNAMSLLEAQAILENAYERDEIVFDELSEEDPELEYMIESDSCNEDGTFCETEYSDRGIQLLK